MNKNSKAVKLFIALSMVTVLTACNNAPEQKDGGEEGGALPTDNAPASVKKQPNLEGQESGEQADEGQESGEQADEGQASGEQADEGQESGEQADEGQESGEQADEGQASGEQANDGQASGGTDKVKKEPGNR